MKKVNILLLIISLCNLINGQVIDNKLQGYYKAKSDSAMYSFFEFDGNGKVNIVGIGTGYYFTKGDSLIVYPDKSLFKFKIKNNTLIGASSWVENETWIKKDTVVANNRKDAVLSQKNAVLLNEYYKITDSRTALDYMLSDTDTKAHAEKISQLCNQGLSKACLDYFGMLLLQDQGFETLLNNQKNEKSKPINPVIIALGNKIIAQGEIEGYTVLGAYYYLLGNKEKAKELWNTGADKGSQQSAMGLMQMEIE
ncbi:hypothetical protein [Flavobacterium sp. KJJ]|uniref:hypothetical protein n=1 Tax=Flavobacterium sp. KJJ TaxID=1270193 RepID=UPI0004935297|nr:hypothetical protein [Flavobacterium sp. KJJ]